MTLGYLQREMRSLEARVDGLEQAKINTDKAFRRLVVWTILAALAGGAAVLVAYFH